MLLHNKKQKQQMNPYKSHHCGFKGHKKTKTEVPHTSPLNGAVAAAGAVCGRTPGNRSH